MKKTFLFCTKPWPFLCVIPPLAILAFSIYYNPMVDTPGRLYPLIVFCCLCAVFIFLYFFRMISISTEEIQSIGLFSSKDSAIIQKDTSLVFTKLKSGKLRVELDGKSAMPDFHWAREEDYVPLDINLYRDRAVGGDRAICRVLSYFGVDREDITALLSAETDFVKEYANFTLSSYTENEKRKVKIRFNETI